MADNKKSTRFGAVHSWIAMDSHIKSKYGYMINSDETWAVNSLRVIFLIELLGKLGILKKKRFADATPTAGFGRYIS